MYFNNFVAIGFATMLFVSPVVAATLDSASSGLAAPDVTIGFDEVALSTGDNVTNQFAGLGVTFTPALHISKT